MLGAIYKCIKSFLLESAFRAAYLDFKVAKSDEELQQVYRLRYEIFLEAGYIQPNDKKLFHDQYDNYSINLLALKRGTPVATARLILKSPYNFPTQNLFNLKNDTFNPDLSAEVGRLAIHESYRGGRRLISIGIIKLIQETSRKKNIQYLYTNMPEKLMEAYAKFGLRFNKLSEGEPTQANLEARNLIAGYFKKRVLHPYIINIAESEKTLII